MSNAIEQLRSGLIVGHVGLGTYRGVPGNVGQEVHDGDTIRARAIGDFGVRFLGVDAPEISFTLPGEKTFTGLADPKWEAFLSDPFNPGLPRFKPALDPGLRAYLESHVGPGTALNHYRLASAAEVALEQEVTADVAALGKTEETFQFLLFFSHEVMDRYGRMLAFINRFEPAKTETPRPLTYNERLLKTALITPYFIWPNINPFRRQGSITQAVIPPGKANQIATKEKSLADARRWIEDARQNQIGIFDPNDPLRLLPFELRFLSQRRPPERWAIDLSKNDDLLIRPQNYYTIPNMEDRLFIPEEYVPLFVEAGWKRQE
ncbi:MAG: hypothetical protein HY282_17170 [Nitrospirae bacterium]|nr:hypothetical protein [Candidatus Manganitrophaceae bacterium]